MEIEWGVLIVWLNYCVYVSRLVSVEAGHQRWGRRRHSGVQSEWVRERLGAAFGSDDVMRTISGLNTPEKTAQMC